MPGVFDTTCHRLRFASPDFLKSWLNHRDSENKVAEAERRMKTEAEQVKLDKTINERLWEKGCEKPPLSIRVRAVKFADGEVQAELAQ